MSRQTERENDTMGQTMNEIIHINEIARECKRRERRMESMKDNVQILVEILGIQPMDIRPSYYQGIEIVLSYEPYHCITVVGSGCHSVYCYSKKEFPGSTYNGMGDWELSL